MSTLKGKRAKSLPVLPSKLLEDVSEELGKRAAPGTDRIPGEELSDEVIAAAVERANAQKAQAQKARQIKAHRKSTHNVEHSAHRKSAGDRGIEHEVVRDNDMPTQWREPKRLDAPPTRPGFVQRYVRFRAGNEEDAENFEDALESGWRPRIRETVKRAHELTASTHEKHGRYYVKRGLILMEMSQTLNTQRNRFYRQQTANMIKGVDRTMFKLNHRVMPLLTPERVTNVTTRARRGALDELVPGNEGAQAEA